MIKKINYTSLSAELDEIIKSMQTAELGIDEAVGKYERGMAIIKELESHLKLAENKVVRVKAKLQDKSES